MTLILSGTDGLSDVDGSAATPAIRGTDTNTGIFFPAPDTIAFSEGGTEAMRLDSAGNMGLGVTPSAWNTGVKAIEGTSDFKVMGGLTFDSLSNAYLNTSNAWIYRATGSATFVRQTSGEFRFFNAASGTAGNAISWTQAMTLNASGNLLVGTTTETGTGRLRVAGEGVRIADSSTESNALLISSSSTTSTIATRYATPLIFGIDGTERARFNSDGNFGVGDNSIPANALICTTTNTASLRTSRFALNPSDGNFTIGFRNGVVGSTSGTEIGRLSAQYTGSDMGWISFTRGAGADLALIRVTNTSAGVSLAVGGTSWGSLSDERSKTNLVAIDNALAKVATLRAVTGRYIEDSDDKRRVFLIAQDVLAVLPEAVSVQDDEEGTLLLQYTEVIPLLVAAIKEQQAIITQLQADVASLKGTP